MDLLFRFLIIANILFLSSREDEEPINVYGWTARGLGPGPTG